MRLRTIALALSLASCVSGLAEAAKKPTVVKHNSAKVKVHKYNAKKAQRQAKKSMAKRRKGQTA